MGFDLTSESGSELRFSGHGWALILNVAEAYGWKPAGTLPPDGEHAWSGVYDSNDGQTVTAKDAASMAVALSATVNDPEGHSRQVAVSRELSRAIHEMLVQEFGEEDIGPFVEEQEPAIIPDNVIREVVAFLTEGSFRID